MGLLEPGELIVTQRKNGKSRTIPLTSEARRIAQLQMSDVTNWQFLFTSKRRGGAVAEIKTGFAGAVTDAGIEDFRFHDLRHTFATRLNEAGVDPVTRRDLLGHSTIEMSNDYTHSSLEGRRRAIQVLSANQRDANSDYGKITSSRVRMVE